MMIDLVNRLYQFNVDNRLCPVCGGDLVKQGIIAHPVKGKKGIFIIYQRYQCKGCRQWWYYNLDYIPSDIGESLSEVAKV